MTRALAKTRSERRAALMPYLTCGWPELMDTDSILAAMVEGGADVIEFGIPFSDPIADGTTVQRANQRALANGVTPVHAFEATKRARAGGVDVPLLYMGYYNPIFSYGLARYAAACAEAGADGLLVPDLPPEESDALLEACLANGIHLIYFLAPTSTPARIDAVLQRANGFIYLISLTGVTGARAEMAAGLEDYVARVRGRTELPLAIGFGISRREHFARVEQLADGALVGAAFLEAIEQAAPGQAPAAARDFLKGLRGL